MNSMEFKFRAVDDRTPQHLSPSPSSTFVHEPLRGFPAPISPVINSIQREREKEKIREEIIAEEIARRRILEAEVRRELMMEREMAMRRGPMAGGLSFEERLITQIDQRRYLMRHNQPQHIMDGRFLDEQFRFFGGYGAFDAMPLLLPPLPPQSPPLPAFRRSSESMVAEVKSLSDSKKDKLIALAKPDLVHLDAKRKAEKSPSADGNEISSIFKKKLKEEWNCSLCQVRVTSEKGLHEHLQGKRHKANEAELRSERMERNSKSNPFTKKKADPTKLLAVETPGNQGNGLHNEGGSGKNNGCQHASLQHMVDIHYSDKKNDKRPLQSNQNLKSNINAVEMGEQDERTEKLKKTKFKFWCEMCQVGAFNEKVMESHKKGKKHRVLLELSQSKGAISTSATLVSVEATQKPKSKLKDADRTIEDADEKIKGAIAIEESVSHPHSMGS